MLFYSFLGRLNCTEKIVLNISVCLPQYCTCRPVQCVGNIIIEENSSFLNFSCISWHSKMGQREFIISTSLDFPYFYKCQFPKLIQGNIHFSVKAQIYKQFRIDWNHKSWKKNLWCSWIHHVYKLGINSQINVFENL